MNEIDESFSYTTLYLLRNNLLFNNKRSISLIEALEGRRILEWSLNGDGLCFKEIDEQEEFMKFLDECKDIVHYKKDEIILNDDITEYNIDEKFTFIKPAKYLDYNPAILKYLGINKPIDFINKYCDLERNIEQLYMNNNNGESSKALDCLYKEKEKILETIKNSDEDYIDMITSVYSDIYNEVEEDYTIFPINRAKYLSSRHYDESRKINDLLYEPYQCALFSDYPLFRTKVKHDFNKIIDDSAEEELKITKDNNEMFDPNEEYYDETCDKNDEDEYEDDIDYNLTNVSDEFPDGFDVCINLTCEQELFMLEYIKTLEGVKDEYKNITGDLELLINRLKYMVDNSNIGLYKGNNIEDVIDDYKNKVDSDYMRIADEVMYFISEIFNTYYDRFCVKKILFVKTYYELTNDLEIINYINEFKDSKLYNHVYKIITGEYSSKVKRK